MRLRHSRAARTCWVHGDFTMVMSSETSDPSDANEAGSSLQASIPAVPSLLSQLRAPPQSGLMRKRKVRVNPIWHCIHAHAITNWKQLKVLSKPRAQASQHFSVHCATRWYRETPPFPGDGRAQFEYNRAILEHNRYILWAVQHSITGRFLSIIGSRLGWSDCMRCCVHNQQIIVIIVTLSISVYVSISYFWCT